MHQQQLRKNKNAKAKYIVWLTHTLANPSQQTLQRHSINYWQQNIF